MKRFPLIMSALILVLAMIAVLLFSSGTGVRRSALEQDARTEQKIDETWSVVQADGERISALIFYPEDGSQHVFSIYVKHPGLSFGWQFCGGGSYGYLQDDIWECSTADISERAFLSMNAARCVKMTLDNGQGLQTTELDANRPFAFVLPANCGVVSFYDENGQRIETVRSDF